MISPIQLRAFILDTLMYYCGGSYASDSAVNLLMLTAAQESHCGSYIKQVGGPAMGIYQIEPATLKDLQETYLRFNAPQAAMFERAAAGVNESNLSINMQGNLVLQTVVARLIYRRFKDPIPETIAGWADYWKLHWNTVKGKGTVAQAMNNYYRYAMRAI